jgi:hypothetical protein
VHRGCERRIPSRPAGSLAVHKFHPAYDEDEDLHGTDLGELLRALRAVDDDPERGS